jgi:hypothetical protein
MVNRKKNGDVFVVEKTITPLRDSDGEITHFISNDRDITDQRRLETQLQQAQKMDAIAEESRGSALHLGCRVTGQLLERRVDVLNHYQYGR